MNYIYFTISVIVGVLFAFIVPIIVDGLIQYKQKNARVEYVDRKPSVLFCRLYSAITGIVFSYLSFVYFPKWKVMFLLVFCLIACVGTFVDNRIRIISNEMVVLMLLIAIPYRIIDGGLPYLLNSVLSMIGIFVFLVGTFFLIGKFMTRLAPGGAGDLKLMMTLGFLVGYPNMIIAVFFTMIVMLIYIIFGLITKRLLFKSYIPMAGFIMLGILVGFLSGGMNLWELIPKTGLI